MSEETIEPSGVVPPSADPFASQSYLLRRKVFTIRTRYHIYDAAGRLALFTRKKSFRIREDIRLYSDETMERELLTISTKHVIDFSAGYDVHDPVAGEKVGSLKRRGLKSMFRDEWVVTGPQEQPIGVIREDSTALALVRRFIDFVAFLFPQKYHVEVDGRTVAVFEQHFNPFVQKIGIDFTADEGRRLDRRLGLAAAVLLAAIEGRQG